VEVAGDHRRTGRDVAQFDLRALVVVIGLLAGLGLLSAGSLWYQTWTLGPRDSNWLGTFPDWFGVLAPVFAGFGVWLWWFARRIAHRHGLRTWPAHVACIVALVAALVWAVWMVELYAGIFPTVG
jgi:cytochrome bd-type quinol oxidase subunit 2